MIKKIAVVPAAIVSVAFLGMTIFNIDVEATGITKLTETTMKVQKQEKDLQELDININDLNKRMDISIKENEATIYQLSAVDVAVSHGFSKEVGLTIIEEAKKYGFTPAFIMGLIDVESSWTNASPNEFGATGLMQVIPETGQAMANELGISSDVSDPVTNIKLGTYYLYKLVQTYGDIDTALTAYNRGPGGLASYQNATGTSVSYYSSEVQRRANNY